MIQNGLITWKPTNARLHSPPLVPEPTIALGLMPATLPRALSMIDEHGTSPFTRLWGWGG
jgi:hypothetical protein